MNQVFVDDFIIRGRHDVGRLVQLGNHTGHLGASAAFTQNVDSRIGRFKLLFNFSSKQVYFLNFLLNPASPTIPVPKRNMVAGSGTRVGGSY